MTTPREHPNPGLAPLIDTHAHIDSEDYNTDRDEVIRRAWEFGLTAMVTVGFEPADWDKTLRITAEHPQIYAALGIHPNSADQTNDETMARLAALSRDHSAVALGETGLDYYRDYVPHQTQQESFRAHLALARDLDLPIIIHTRDAHTDVLEILRTDGKGTRGVMHAFSGDMAYALECIELGYMISLAGPVTFRKAVDRHVVARGVPLDWLLVETDCPYLTPEPFRGRRNEPAYVAYTARAIANLRGESLERVAMLTSNNAKRLFGLR
jgi:TatD DNase family protein